MLQHIIFYTFLHIYILHKHNYIYALLHVTACNIFTGFLNYDWIGWLCFEYENKVHYEDLNLIQVNEVL